MPAYVLCAFFALCPVKKKNKKVIEKLKEIINFTNVKEPLRNLAGAMGALILFIWEKPKMKALEIITLALVIVTGVLAWLAFCQWRTMQAEQRPWVTVSGIKEIPDTTKKELDWPRREGDIIRFDLAHTLTNVGKTPAYVAVEIDVLLDPLSGSKERKKVEQKICRDLRSKIERKGWEEQYTVFPNQSFPYHTRDSELLDTNMVQANAKNIEKRPCPANVSECTGTGWYSPWVIGCVCYKSPEDSAVHSTPFVSVLSVEKEEESTWGPRDRPKPINVNWPKAPNGKKLVAKSITISGLAD